MCACRKNRNRRSPSPDRARAAATRKQYEIVKGTDVVATYSSHSQALAHIRSKGGAIRPKG